MLVAGAFISAACAHPPERLEPARAPEAAVMPSAPEPTPSPAPPRSRATAAGTEYLVSGRLLMTEVFCHSPPTPPRPRAGPVRVYAGGQRGYEVSGDPVLTVQADEKAGYRVYLLSGHYCLSGGDSRFCDTELTVGLDASVGAVNILYQKGPGGSCAY